MLFAFESRLPDLLGGGCDLLGLKIWNLAFWPKRQAFRLAGQRSEKRAKPMITVSLFRIIFILFKKSDAMVGKMKVNLHVVGHCFWVGVFLSGL